MINVFVQLAYGTDPAHWQDRMARGEVLGINGASPYGYGLAERSGCTVRYGVDHPEGRVLRVVRRGLRKLLAFDPIHVWRNRRALRAADVVWTHTECQTLGVLLVNRFRRSSQRPRLIGQSVWLFDRWAGFSTLRRALYRWLLMDADVLTVLSPHNLAVVRSVVPEARSELVRFGIATDVVLPSAASPRAGRCGDAPIEILGVGNDSARDWPLLLAAFAGDPRYRLTIVSGNVPAATIAGLDNVRIVRPRDNEELLALYAGAHVSVVPLKANLHASGITVILESTLLGLPVVCTRTGGLEAYFDEGQVHYVPLADAPALRQAVDDLFAQPAERQERLVERALARLTSELGAHHFVERHVALSRQVLGHDRREPVSS